MHAVGRYLEFDGVLEALAAVVMMAGVGLFKVGVVVNDGVRVRSPPVGGGFPQHKLNQDFFNIDGRFEALTVGDPEGFADAELLFGSDYFGRVEAGFGDEGVAHSDDQPDTDGQKGKH